MWKICQKRASWKCDFCFLFLWVVQLFFLDTLIENNLVEINFFCNFYYDKLKNLNLFSVVKTFVIIFLREEFDLLWEKKLYRLKRVWIHQKKGGFHKTKPFKKIQHSDNNKVGVFSLYKSIGICIMLIVSGLFSPDVILWMQDWKIWTMLKLYVFIIFIYGV